MTEPSPLWPRIVSAALLGTATRPVPSDGADPVLAEYLESLSPATPPAERVLHIAALTAVAANASGPTPVAGLEPVRCAADDARPAMSAYLAGVVLAALPYPGADQWCLRPVADAGLRAPLRLIPPLLRHTAAHPEAGPAVAALTGPRGAWLAGVAPGIGARLTAPDGAAGPVPAQPDWDALRAADRAAALQDLGAFPAGGDAEALCERGLDDRTATVRAAAVHALRGTVGTAYEGRMRARAAALVRRRRALLGDKLEVAALGEPDADAQRDGVAWPPPQGISPSAHWVEQLSAALPLAAWEEILDAPPERLVGASGEFFTEFRTGWRERAAREREPRWAAALARSGEPTDLALVPGPWNDALCEKVIRAFSTMLRSDDWRPLPAGETALIATAARNLPVGPRSPWPHRVGVLVAQSTGPRAQHFAPLTEILRLRTAIAEELPQ